MREIYPPHYAAFHCIAGACPDSCCKEWEIVVDAESVEKYQMVSGELGNRLRQAMITDADGDVIFQEREKRCPFWNAQQLCDIHGGLGEAALCETCRQFPRVTQDYGDFIEYDISPACPEAARLLMELTPEQWLLSENDCPEVTGSFPEYDGKRPAPHLVCLFAGYICSGIETDIALPGVGDTMDGFLGRYLRCNLH